MAGRGLFSTLFAALSVGALSRLPDVARLAGANLAARGTPSDDLAAANFLRVQRRISEAEGTFDRAMAGRNRSDIAAALENGLRDKLSRLLFAPETPSIPEEDDQPPQDAEESSSERAGQQAPWRPFARTGPPIGEPDPAEEFYRAFFASHIYGRSTVATEDIENLANQIVERAAKPPAETGIRPIGADTEAPEFSRRLVAYSDVTEALRRILVGFESDRELAKSIALSTIADLRSECVRAVSTALGSRRASGWGDLLGVLAARVISRVTAKSDNAKRSLEDALKKLDPQDIAKTILFERLKAIDDTFGESYRATRRRHEREHRSWDNVRAALLEGKKVLYASLSENVRRNELRREIIAGSVQCYLGNTGGRVLRFSSGEASGPPSYFERWKRPILDAREGAKARS